MLVNKTKAASAVGLPSRRLLAAFAAALVGLGFAPPATTHAADRPPPPLALAGPAADLSGQSGVRGTDGLVTFTFTDKKIGLRLDDEAGTCVVRRVDNPSPAWKAGVLPLTRLVRVDGRDVTTAAEASVLVKESARPLALVFDVSAYAGFSPDAVIEKAASAEGLETARVAITRLDAAGRSVRPDRVASCGYASRESDVLEVEYSATVEGSGAEFDSSAQRSGRPFALMLGNSDSLPGLEVGLFEMCVGERRRVRVPPRLGFPRGSKTFGIPPGSTLVFDVTLVSINGQTDPALRREDVADERRF